MTTPDEAPSALALRVWDLARQHLVLRSFNARPAQTPPWWIDTAFSEPTGGWPKDRPLVAECKAKGEHTPHLPECRDDCEEHDGGIPAPGCRCGIYCTRSLGVVSDYLRAANEPVLGLVEMGGRFILAEPGSDGYARGQYARVVAILLIDKSLTIDHPTLRNLAAAYRVPALVPHSTDPDDFRDRITVTSTIADEAEAWLRGLDG
jgi:hypothetical protein